MAQTKAFFINVLVPSLALRRVLAALYSKDSKKRSNQVTLFTYTLLFVAWIALFISVIKSAGIKVFGWTCFFANGIILMSIKSTFRERYQLSGNTVSDFFSSLFFYPCVLWQLEEQSAILGLPEQSEDRRRLTLLPFGVVCCFVAVAIFVIYSFHS